MSTVFTYVYCGELIAIHPYYSDTCEITTTNGPRSTPFTFITT
ncbi:MAG TPA: hypothetical protein VHB70_17175 [Parafilimonas sp.]|nr:hypothetical protein [Parafilimonas sp.]